VINFVDFAEKKNEPAVVCFYIHPWEFIPCKKSYNFGEATVIPDDFITKNTGNIAIKELRRLIKNLKDSGAKFNTAKEIAEIWRKR